MKQTLIGLILFCFLIVPLSAAATKQYSITLQANESAPYWTEKDSSGGMGSEIVQAISKEMGISTKIEFRPLKRMIADTSNNDLGDPLFYMNNQDFAAIIPIGIMHSAWFTYHKTAHNISEFSFSDDKRIGALIGTMNNVSDLDKFGKFEESYSRESLFKKLKAGRVDLIVELNLAGRETIHKLFPNEIDHFDIKVIPESAAPIALMIDSDYPDGAILGNRYKEGLHRILKNGVYLKILEKYYTKGSVPPHFFSDLSKFETLYSSDLGGNGL